LTTDAWRARARERPDDMTFESGGQGLWSTLDDYLAFARIFLGRGEVDGVRLLRPETCAMMASNQLTSTSAGPLECWACRCLQPATVTAWASRW
jgi:CubicO group peptidase (beta-lactamase class C family)